MLHQKVKMEFLQPVQHAEYHILLRENCSPGKNKPAQSGGEKTVLNGVLRLPEMVSSWLLPKSTPGDDADAGVFQQLEGIVDIGRLTILFGLRNRLLWQMELREGVHCSPHIIARKSLD